jgi:pimeloyl-ACP methyl ester carboxylesterase
MIKIATWRWRKFGLDITPYSIGWRERENDFNYKIQRLVALIDELSQKGNIVSLIGTSAGGSAVLNAFIERKDIIHRVVNICGRLRTGSQKGFRSFKTRTASSPAFAQSVKFCEKRESELSNNDRLKVMTVRAMFGDELVPGDTAILEGAHNIKIPTIGHIFSIGATLTLFSGTIISFLNRK